MYHPLPALVPHVLAPASPASPASTAANPSTLNLDLATKRLAALDAPRRKFGLSYAVPPRLGLPQLICTGVHGIWSASTADADAALSGDEHPPWVRTGQAHDLEEDASDDPYRKGLPRDEEEAERWAEARRQKRRQAKATTKVQRIVVDHVEPVASTSSSYVRETDAGAEVPIRKTRGEAHGCASKSATTPQLVTSHFTATKATVAASHTKKRPAGSPPPPGTAATGPPRSGPRSSAATGRASKRSPSPAADRNATDGGLKTKGTSRGRAPTGSAATTQVVGETETFDPFVAEEVLFERGCTQMELPDPPASSASAHLPRATPTKRTPSAAHPLAPPFSSPGLMNGNGSDSGTMLLDTAGMISTPRPLLAGAESGGKRESQKQPQPPPPPHLPSPNSLPVAFPGTERPATAAAAAAARRPGPSRAMTADSVTSGIVGAGAATARKSLTRLGSPSTTGSGDGRLVEAAGGAGVGFTTDSLGRERELDEIEDFLHQNISG